MDIVDGGRGGGRFTATCQHNYVERSGTPLIGTLAARVCKRCDRLEVLFASTQCWLTLDEYDAALAGVGPRS